MNPIPTLRSPRLLLRPLRLDDADAIQALFPRWEVVRYLAAQMPWPYPADGAWQFLRNLALPAMAAGRAWHWSLRRREAPDRLIGVISLMDEEDNNRGFWIDPQWQGQGLMSEACEAVTAFWFEVLGRPHLRVPKASANIASRRISERSGMQVIGRGEGDYVSGRLPFELWEITREAWLLRHPASDAGSLKKPS